MPGIRMTVNMAFSQTERGGAPTWGDAPGYGDQWPLAKKRSPRPGAMPQATVIHGRWPNDYDKPSIMLTSGRNSEMTMKPTAKPRKTMITGSISEVRLSVMTLTSSS